MIQFILNEKEISTDLPKGTLLLDFIRYHKNLTGTKIGCREGDCGACTVLLGEIKKGELIYNSFTSCLTPLGNAHGKHVVTIEGVNVQGLNYIQQAFADEGATQCGFCTPGFIVSLAGFCIDKNTSFQSGIDAVNGNICRCTGYKSIERAIEKIADKMSERNGQDAIQFAVQNNILPAYFNTIRARLMNYSLSTNGIAPEQGSTVKFVAGGTDLYVQQHDTIADSPVELLFDKDQLNGIFQQGNKCIMGASVTVTDILKSPVFQQHFPSLYKYMKLVSSTQIRNMATIAGNIINASPIGDLTIFFLALDAQLILSDGVNKREIALRKFYKGYKQLDKTNDEFIEQIYFELPTPSSKFNFEKVSKRTNLDIASVNTAIHLTIQNETIIEASLSAGGIGPVPAYLQRSSSFLSGKTISPELVSGLVDIAQEEISPISDARGTATYKRLLLGQLIKAHFVTLFPALDVNKLMTA
ncbi:MAG: FAD binding domain-containing protein [Ferruginibacter sp.]